MDGIVRGKALKYGDNINTDLISPPQYLEKPLAEIARHAMEGIDEGFAARVRPGDVLVAGANFGPGSSRETAPIALKMAGVGAVVAKFFARIFYRNAINIGLPVLECREAGRIGDGDELEVDLGAGTITDKTTGEVFRAAPLSAPVMDILSSGGLIPYLEKRYGGG